MINSENRLADERKVLETLISASFHYVHLHLSSYGAMDVQQNGKIIEMMMTAAAKLPKAYGAIAFVDLLVAGEPKPHVEMERKLSEYVNGSWKMFLERKYRRQSKAA